MQEILQERTALPNHGTKFVTLSPSSSEKKKTLRSQCPKKYLPSSRGQQQGWKADKLQRQVMVCVGHLLHLLTLAQHNCTLRLKKELHLRPSSTTLLIFSSRSYSGYKTFHRHVVLPGRSSDVARDTEQHEAFDRMDCRELCLYLRKLTVNQCGFYGEYNRHAEDIRTRRQNKSNKQVKNEKTDTACSAPAQDHVQIHNAKKRFNQDVVVHVRGFPPC